MGVMVLRKSRGIWFPLSPSPRELDTRIYRSLGREEHTTVEDRAAAEQVPIPTASQDEDKFYTDHTDKQQSVTHQQIVVKLFS